MMCIHPFPEILRDGANWRVRPGRGTANLETRTLYVPMDMSVESRFIRTHELLHAEMTKGKIGEKAVQLKVGIDCLNAVEDARINRFIRGNISDVEAVEGGGLAAPATTDLGQRIAKSGSLRAAVLALLASSSSSRLRLTFEEALRAGSKPLHRKALALANRAERLLFHRCPPTQRWGELVAQRLEALLRAEGASTEDQVETARALLKPLLGGAESLDDATEHNDVIVPPGIVGRSLRAGAQSKNCWGKLEIDRLPLVREQDGRLARRWRPTMEGAGVRYLHRLAIDRAIFASRRRVRGGSVLIDASGSMRLSADNIAAMVRAAPSATVAAYAGREDHGYLWILAARGKVADLAAWTSKRCAGNIVDGPALKWLALQERPRIWVSDGCVSGIGDGSAPNLLLESKCIVSAGNIRQARDMKAALKLLRPGGTVS